MLFFKLFFVYLVAQVSFAGRLPCKSHKINRNDQRQGTDDNKPERRSKPRNSVIGLTDKDFMNARNIEIKNTNTDGTDNEKISERAQARIDGSVLNPYGMSQVKLWPDGQIYYQIAHPEDPSLQFEAKHKAMIATAICLIELRSCVRIIFSDTEEDYLSVERETGGCSCYIGKIGGKQVLTLTPQVDGRGCFDVPGIAVHEFLHAAGFNHEHQRIDRDKHIEVHFDNIPQNQHHNFNYEYPPSGTYAGNETYDLKSVMQYHGAAFAYSGTKSITAVDKKITRIGTNRKDLSALDIKMLNTFYKCKDLGNGKWLVDGEEVKPTKCKKLRGM